MKTTKKLLSVLLAVMMIVTSISVCFTSFAVGGTATDEQWNVLLGALNNDAVKNAAFSTNNGKYTVDDPDGSVLAAVEAYWVVFEKLANTDPATGNPNNTSNSTGSSEGNRTINQVNTSIKNYIAGMAGYEAYMGEFVGKLIGTANVSAGTGATQTKGGANDESNDKTVPGTNLGKIDDISLTVVSSSAITGYTLDNLPETVVTEKTFTVSHANDRYDYTYATGTYETGSGCNKVEHTSYTRTYKYFYYISGTSADKGEETSTQVITDAAATLEANADYFTTELSTLVATEAETLGDVKDAVTGAKTAVVNAFSVAIFNHFFSAYDVDALATKIDLAVEIKGLQGTVANLNKLVADGYNGFALVQLETLANNLKNGLDTYDGKSQAAKDYVVAEGFDRAAVQTFYEEVLREIELAELRNLKVEIDTNVPAFYDYNEDNVADRTVSGEELNYAKGTVEGYIISLNSYADGNIAVVWEGKDIKGELAELSETLENLITVNGYTDAFANKYAEYVAEVYENTNIADDSADLLAAIQSYDSWFTGLKALIAEIETELGADLADKIFTELDTAMKAHLDSKYNALHARVLAQIDTATDLYNLLKDYENITIVNVNTYANLEKILKDLERDVYEFLLASANFEMPAETKAKYDALANIIFDEYYAFLESGGFSSYEQTEIADIVREDLENDIFKENSYTVTDEKVEKVIDAIEGLLADETIKNLLGGLINEDGAPFDLAALLGGLIDGLFTDDLLNTIIGFLYPAVTKEFAKVWAGLPESITVEDIDTGILGIKADVTAKLDLYTVEKATHAIGMSIFPLELAEKLRAEYPAFEAVAAVLDDVKTAAAYQLNGDGDEDDTYTGDPWKDAALYTNVLDENGEPVLNEDGTNKTALNFTWGIDEAENKREAFIDAAVAALSGLEPLLLALLSNQYYESINKIGTGSGSAQVVISLNLSVDPIDLVFKVSNNPGYNNVIAPILEVLGMVAPDGNTLTTTRKVLEDGLFGPIDALLAKIAANPLDTILSILPNAMYAISAGRILPLLDMLKINIEYTTNASYSVIGLINGSMNDVYKSEEPIKINVKDMINLDDMGLDLSFPGIWSMISGLLGEGVTLPEIDAGYLATLGELTWKDTKRSEWTYTPLQTGKAAYIEANKADVLIYLVRYLLGALKANPDLLASFGLELPELVTEILAGATANPDYTIAAIVELFDQVDVTSFDVIEWYKGLEGYNPLTGAYKDGNNWTKETADYIVDNLLTVLGALGLDINETIGGLFAKLFTNANITKLAKLLSVLDLNALLAGDEEEAEDEVATVAEGDEEEAPEAAALDITALVNDLLGVDLSGFAAYADLADDATWDFEDGDAAGFVAALLNLLDPLMPVVDFLLADGNLKVLDSETGAVITLYGANGYANAIAPLLNALGCEAPELKAGDNVLAVILNSILAKVNAILENPVDALQVVVDLIYYLRSDALTVAVKNLLTPVYVLLDTIRPIYDLDLNELLAGLTADLGITIDLNKLDLDFILTLVETLLADTLGGLDLHTLNGLIDEVATLKAKNDEYSNSDILTVVLNYLVSQIKGSEDFQAFLKGILDLVIKEDAELTSDDVMILIANIFNMEAPEVLDIEWILTEYADKETVVTPFEGSELYEGFTYGEYYTEDMAEYISTNFPEFVDNIIYLLGLDLDGDGTYARDLAGVLESLDTIVNGTIYNSELLGKLLEAIKGLVAKIDEVEAIAALAPQVKELVKLALGVDLTHWDNFEIPEFTNDRAKFVEVLCDMLSPLYPVLEWLLGDKNISFFVDKEQNDLITLLGAEGYAYGIIPILEALGCEDVMTPADYYAAVAEDGSVLLTSILNPLLDRVDEILADPAAELLDILPNLIYFINSDGLDVAVKNLLNAVYTVLNAIKPLVEVDLYAIVYDAIGIDIDTVTFESLFTFALDKIKEATGIELVGLEANALAELTIGKVVSFTSANGKTAYRMEYADGAHKAEMVTVLARLIVTFIAAEGGKNADNLVALLKENFGMDDAAAENFCGFLQSIIDQEVNSAAGMDKALALIYYVFYGADFVIDQTTGAVNDFNAMWKDILETIGRDEDNEEAITIGNILADVLDITLGGVIDSEGVASNGFIRFFQRIAEFFQKIMDWFRNLFA